MVPGDWTAASGAAAFARILEADPTIDALFAASDQMALGALHVANASGIAIPDRLAVVGFDGLPEAAEFTPVAHHHPPAAAGDRPARGRGAGPIAWSRHDDGVVDRAAHGAGAGRQRPGPHGPGLLTVA